MSNSKRQIFGLSNSASFFVEGGVPPLFQRHLLGLANVKRPRICYLGTARGDAKDRIELFYNTMRKHDCDADHMDMFAPQTDRFLDFFRSFDMVFIDGGSTLNMLNLWAEWGVSEALMEAYHDGLILAGASAGLICWFEGAITDSYPKKLRPLAGLGLLPGSCCTHFDARDDRPIMFEAMLRERKLPAPAFALEDDTALHFVDGVLADILSVTPGKKVHRFAWENGRLGTRMLDPTLLA